VFDKIDTLLAKAGTDKGQLLCPDLVGRHG
jgi:hypothetical protein